MQIAPEEIDDLMESFKEQAEISEQSLACISNEGAKSEYLNELFRAIHTIKGNAAIFAATALVDYTHCLEEIVEALRADALTADDIVCECLLLGLDRLRDLHERELLGTAHENLHEKELEQLFKVLSEANIQSVEPTCREIMDLLGAGFAYPECETEAPKKVSNVSVEPFRCIQKPDEKSKLDFDLEFFEELAHQVDRQSQFWQGRTDTQLNWALKINEQCQDPVDIAQLSAAVFMHDIGMTYVSGQTLDKRDTLTEHEKNEIKQHPMWGYKYLIRVQDWDVAATIVLEHHERVDGFGYPLGIKQDLIHTGAKILAIIDAYFSMTHGRADRTSRRSIVRAICEINARKGSQFDEEYVNIFNDVIKAELRDKSSS